MKIRRVFWVGLIIALMIGFAGSAPAKAQSGTYLEFTDIAASSCTPGASAVGVFDYAVAANDTSLHIWTLTNLRNGNFTTYNVGPIPGPEGPFPGTTNSMTVPADTVVGDTLKMEVIATSTLPDAEASYSWISFDCASGNVIGLWFDYLYYVYQGPTVPKGFVLRTISCDTGVYGEPNSNLVSGAKIKAGQTWFVNPTTKTGSDGASWTEVFLAGPNNGWIPSACVGVAPAGY